MIIAYTYYSTPWGMSSGDDVRIHNIFKELSTISNKNMVAYVLSHRDRREKLVVKDGVIYYVLPRRFYNAVSSFLGWKNKNELNALVKLTNYVDEFLAAARISKAVRPSARFIYITGSMSLISWFLKIFGVRKPVMYDPLANYLQTLYLRSRNKLIEKIRYSLYAIIHKKQLNSSDCVVYPSFYDKTNAVRSFRIKRAYEIPNPYPICYDSVEEAINYRKYHREAKEVPYFILLSGGKGKGNLEAIKLVLKVFNSIDPQKFRLIITGPWKDLGRHVKNKSIRLVGYVPQHELKKLLATSDYGISPVFSHSAGTFIKILAYMAAGLDIITAPYGIAGLPLDKYKGKVYIARDPGKFKLIINKIISLWAEKKIRFKERANDFILCNQIAEEFHSHVEKAISDCVGASKAKTN